MSKGTLVNAEQHVAAMERYPLLGSPEVSQKQALELAKVLDGLAEGEEWWPNARRNPLGPPPPKDAKNPGYDLVFQAFRGCSHQGSFASFGGGHVRETPHECQGNRLLATFGEGQMMA